VKTKRGLFLSACYKTLIFIISHCWQVIMVRTKTRMDNGYTRVRTVSATTVTTHFIPSIAMPRRERFRQMEHQILRNLHIIQEFNLANYTYTGPISTDHARAQRQRYEIVRENCEVTNKVNHALHLSEDNAVCARAFHGIFLSLKTMLNNEVTRAEAINLRAVNYWHQHSTLDSSTTQTPQKVRRKRSHSTSCHTSFTALTAV
jgi:hypothetical protein